MKFLMPDKKSITDMLSMLLGDDLTVKQAAAPMTDAAYAAIYVDSDAAPGAVCLCSKTFVVYAGAALSMVPPGGARDALKEAVLPEVIAGNFNEVMNICTRLVMSEETPHLRLAKVCLVSAADGLDLVEKAGSRADFELVIPKYGSGFVAFLVT